MQSAINGMYIIPHMTNISIYQDAYTCANKLLIDMHACMSVASYYEASV